MYKALCIYHDLNVQAVFAKLLLLLKHYFAHGARMRFDFSVMEFRTTQQSRIRTVHTAQQLCA
jgi:ABC-type hemin transport system ATPase subunit